jgi:diguanylate cyclase (GGDEF)-like protein
MLDLDHFKEINDKYGHQFGDMVLKKIADMLTHDVRKSDVVARYGGEEFAVILTETPEKGAHTAAERLRMHIHDVIFTAETLRLNIGKEEFAIEEGGHLNLTISIGIGYFDGQDKELTPAQLISRADRALYSAKADGRNKTEVWYNKEQKEEGTQ